MPCVPSTSFCTADYTKYTTQLRTFRILPSQLASYHVLAMPAPHWIRPNNDPPSSAVSKHIDFCCYQPLAARLYCHGSLLWRPLRHCPQTKHLTTHLAVLAQWVVLRLLCNPRCALRLSLKGCQALVSTGTLPGQSGAVRAALTAPTLQLCEATCTRDIIHVHAAGIASHSRPHRLALACTSKVAADRTHL